MPAAIRCTWSLAVLLLPLGPLLAADSRPFGAVFDKSDVIYPACGMVVDVTKPPYRATGDGRTDDTTAIQKALTDTMGQHKMLYFPAGTYLVSKTLMWSKKDSAGRDAWGKNFLQGQNVAKTIIRLKTGTFTDEKQPQAIMWCGGFGSADWFHNYVQDITFDVGDLNPGAVGLQFYSNNSGAVRNCRFVAAAGSGVVGLDLGHRDMNGPLLVRNCEVVGFRRGISTGNAVNGQVLEHITLKGQTEVGFTNAGQSVSIRSLVSENAVPAVSTYGILCLVDALLTGKGAAAGIPAIVNFNFGRLFLRDIVTTGYGRAVGDVETPDSAAAIRIRGADKPGSQGPNVPEYCSHKATTPFGGGTASLRLPIQEPPEMVADPAAKWANVDTFGADPSAKADSSAAIQKAIDSGATTVFLPGQYAIHSTVVVRGKVRHIVGIGGAVDYFSRTKPNFRIADGDSPVVVFEHFAFIQGGIEIDTKRTVVFRSVSDCPLTGTARAAGGDVFFDDFVTQDLRLNKQRVWARQLNIENEGTHLTNDASDLWVLGYKTERGGTLLDTRGGGRSEILGGFSYTTTAGKKAPMFVTDGAAVFAYFGEVCYNGDPFQTLIRETRGTETKVVKRGEGSTTPYIAVPTRK